MKEPGDVSRRELLTVLGSTGMGAVLLGMAGATPASAAPASPDPVGLKVIKDYYATYARLQPELLRKFFADDIEWHIPGHHPLSGTKKGAEEVLAFFAQLAKARFKAELIYLGGNDEYVVDVHRGWSNTGTQDIDMPWVLLYRIQGGKIREARNWAWDQHAADAFFWRAFPLKPIPERLQGS